MPHPERRRRTETLNILLEKAGIQGYLTTDDLMEAYPDAHTDAQRLSVLLIALRRRGVDVFDSGAETDPAPMLTAPDPLEPAPEEWASPPAEIDFANDSVGLYLKEMARVPLLSLEEEVSIARRIETGRHAHARLLRMGMTNAPERRELEHQVQEGQQAREHLIKANTRLVVSVAKRYIGRGVAFLDLIQEGNLGLMKAVEKYDVQRGFRFSTYATWWIRQTISRAIADQSRTIRLPVHMTDRLRQMLKLTHELEQSLGRSPTSEELAQQSGMPAKKVEWIQKIAAPPLSLESPVGDDEENELGYFIEDEFSPTPAESAYASLLREKLEEVLDTLHPREAQVIRLRFGLEDGITYTLEEVGDKFGLTRERIRQIEGKALRRLRHPRRARELREYI